MTSQPRTPQPRVDSLDVDVRTFPTDQPEADGTLAWDSTTVVVVRVAAGGLVGTGWTYGPAACAAVVEDQLRSVVVGSRCTPVPLQAQMVRAVRNAGRDGVCSMAISAIDVALWDLWARLLDLPLHVLLGAPASSSVAVYGSGGFTTYSASDLEAQVRGWLAAGCPAVKIKIGESWGSRVARDLERVEQVCVLVRELAGGDVSVFVDANGGYSVGQAIRVGHALDALGVTWFEEPVSSDDLDGLSRVRSALALDVTAGEYGYDLSYFERMTAAGAVDCLQVDVTRCGGITEWQRVAAVAAAHHAPLSAHCAPSLSYPVAAATPGLRHVEWFHDHVRLESAYFDGVLTPVDGRVTLGDSPGHGLTFRDD